MALLYDTPLYHFAAALISDTEGPGNWMLDLLADAGAAALLPGKDSLYLRGLCTKSYEPRQICRLLERDGISVHCRLDSLVRAQQSAELA